MALNDMEHYLRLILLNSEAASVLRETFEQIVKNTCNSDVDFFLKEFENDIKSHHKLTPSQYKLLFPENGEKSDKSKWDVALLSFVLINCCTLEGKICIRNLRDLMKSKASAFEGMDKFLQFHKSTIDHMRGSSVIDQEQYNKLYPQNSKSNVNEWDTKLLISMLVKFREVDAKEMLKKCVQRDIRLHVKTPNVTDYLKLKKEDCENMQRLISVQQYNELFPKQGAHADLDHWDVHLLEIFVTNVCVCLSRKTQINVKIIQKIRNEIIAHNGSAEIDLPTFTDTWTLLYSAIVSILDIEIPHKKPAWEQKCKDIFRGPFDITGTINILKEYYNDHNEVLAALEELNAKLELESKKRAAENKSIDQALSKLLTMNEALGEKVQKLVETKKEKFTEAIDAESVDVKIEVTSDNKDSKKRTENAIRLAIQDLLQGKRAEIKIKTVQKLIEGMASDGTEIEDIQSGSIVIKIKCYNLKGLTNVLVHAESQELQNNIKEMAEELTTDTGEEIVLGCGIPEESKQCIMKELDRIETEYENKQTFMCNDTGIDIENLIIFDSEDEGDKFEEDIIKSDSGESTDGAESKHSEYTIANIPQVEKIQTFDIKCPEDMKDCLITSSTILPTGQLILSDEENQNIKLFDKHFEYRSVLKLTHAPFQSCLSVDDNTSVLVTVPKQNSIYIFEITGDMRIAGEINVGGKCYGIACSVVGIAVLVKDDEGNYIQLLANDGTYISRVNVLSLQDIAQPGYMLSVADGQHLVISQTRESRLTTVDVNTGHVFEVYEDEDLTYPGRVASDNQGNVYVEDDFSSCVYIINHRGKKIGEILSRKDGLEGPRGLEYNRDNDTLVLQPDWRKNEMSVYTIIQ